MDLLEYNKSPSLKCLIIISSAIVLVILFAGLNPRDFHFSNSVKWLKDKPGIAIDKYGILYTSPFVARGDVFKSDDFSIEMALRPAKNNEKDFGFIVVIENRKDGDQLLVAQWLSQIVVMNGGDYDYRRRTKRISVKIGPPSHQARLLTITTGKEGTKVYIDGELAGAEKDLILRIPEGQDRILLSNSTYGRQSWRGDIYGLALYGSALSGKKILSHFVQWSNTKDFSFIAQEKPAVLYLFDEGGGSKVLDHSGGKHDLEIPPRMKILKKKILPLGWDEWKFNRSVLQDVVINLMGFIPLGFFFAATLLKLGGIYRRHYRLIAICLGFMISLFIEILQMWIPSRSSEMRDLLMNTLGAFLGTMICRFAAQYYLRLSRRQL